MAEPLEPQAAFNHAIHLINSGRVSAAAAFCRDAVERDPEDVNMTALLGAILLKLREFEAAEAHLRRAIELAPTFAKPHEDLGRLLVEQGRAEEAVEVLRAATRLDPKSETAFFTLGRALSMAGDGDQADAAFEASFELNPRRRKLALAAEHHKAGRHEEASRQYRALLAESPNDVDAMRLLAGILASQSDVEEAEALLRKAVSLAPDYALAFLDLGRLFQEQHRYAEAIECFQRTIRLQPSAAKPRHLLASTLAPVAAPRMPWTPTAKCWNCSRAMPALGWGSAIRSRPLDGSERPSTRTGNASGCGRTTARPIGAWPT